MIELSRGDILKADVEALVNTVNCVGVMGRGVALQFRKAFPENYRDYRQACARHEVTPGRMFVHPLNNVENPRYIINFPTKRHWKGRSRLADIDAGLLALIEEVRERGIRSIAVPPLGCGLGGLDWGEVRPRIVSAFERLPDVRVMLFEPAGAPAADRMVTTRRPPQMTIGRAALLALMRRYLAAVMDPQISLLEIHKLMYFMQQAGEGLNLRYRKATYGPYAENLRHVLNAMEGHFIRGYGDAEDRPDKPIELEPEAASLADAFLVDHPETQARFERVVSLIEGFESPFGMELLSTVHWVAAHEGVRTTEEAMARVYAWNERKQMFEARHIQLAWDVLKSHGWLPPDASAKSWLSLQS